MSPDGLPQPGDVLDGKLVVEGVIARGGMGVVLAAKHVRLNRRVAVKVLRRDALEHVDALPRFLREAQAAAALENEHVVRVMDVGTLAGDTPYIVMELLEGQDLAAILRARGALPVDVAVDLLLQACEGISAAHFVGVVHRDVKPANLFLARRPDGSAILKVLDFGISKAATETDAAFRLTGEQSVLGSPYYMSPEQIRSARDVDARSDVWSLGVVLYELVTGALPFEGASSGELGARIAADAPVPMRGRRPEVPERLERVVLTCLEKDPVARYASVTDLAGALALMASEDARSAIARLAATSPATAATEPPETGDPRSGTALTAMLGTPLGPLPREPRRSGIWWIFAGLAAVGASAIFAARPPTADDRASSAAAPPARLSFHPKNIRRITFGETCEEFPSFAPDGDLLAFDATLGPDSFISTMRVGGGTPRRITEPAGVDYAPAISPDGKSIAFLRKVGDKTGGYVIGVDGDPPPRHIADGNTRPSWSPDGRSIWMGDRFHLEKYDVASGALQERITVPDAHSSTGAIELPDGRLVAVFPSSSAAPLSGVGVYGPDRDLEWLAHAADDSFDEALALSPDGAHVLAARSLAADAVELLDLPLDGSPAASLASSGVAARKGISISPGGRHVAWSTCRGRRQLVTISGTPPLIPVEAGSEWEEEDFAWMPGTDRVVVLSQRGGPMRPWIIDLRQHMLPRSVEVNDDPVGVAVSRDGRWLAVVQSKGIEIVPADGSARATPLTTGTQDRWPSFRRRGDEILFTRGSPPDAQVLRWRLGAGGGDQTHAVLVDHATQGVASPTDDRVAYLGGIDPLALVPRILDPKTGSDAAVSKELAPARYTSIDFSADGGRVVVVRDRREVFEIDVRTGARLRSIHLDDTIKRIHYVGSDIDVVRVTWLGDLWVADDAF